MGRKEYVKSIILPCLFVVAFLVSDPVSVVSANTCNFSRLVKQWKGKYPIQKTENIVCAPEINYKIDKILGKRYSNMLKKLDTEPNYLIQPVKLISGCLILDYSPNLHMNEDETKIVIVVDAQRCSVHAALIDYNGKVVWKHYDNTFIPSQVLEIYNTSNNIKHKGK